MAYYFMLSVECGPERESAEAVTEHFEGLSISLPGNLTTTCWASWSQDAQGNWWSVTVPKGANYAAFSPRVTVDGNTEYVHDEWIMETSEQMNAMTVALYDRLREAPPYRFADAGYETEHFWEIDQLLATDMNITCPGLILNREIWQKVGAPAQFVPFSPGYVWQPYEQIEWIVNGHFRM